MGVPSKQIVIVSIRGSMALAKIALGKKKACSTCTCMQVRERMGAALASGESATSVLQVEMHNYLTDNYRHLWR